MTFEALNVAFDYAEKRLHDLFWEASQYFFLFFLLVNDFLFFIFSYWFGIDQISQIRALIKHVIHLAVTDDNL